MACLRAIEVSSEESAKTSGTPRRTAQSRFVRRVPRSAVKAVLEAGGIRAYERQHRTTLANILNRGDRLPADVIPKIVDFWAHLGWYEYSVPGTGSRVVATGPEESSSS